MPAMEAIIEGVETETSEYPWQVGLVGLFDDDRDLDCGGSILSSLTILSAAHCTEHLSFIAMKENVKVVVSQHGSSVGATVQVLDVCSIEKHPYYDSVTVDNDFAILTLCSPIMFYPSVQPICLPSLPAHSYDGVRATTSGWGTSGYDSLGNKLYMDSLMEVNVTTMPNSV